MLLLVKLQVLACNFTNSNTRPWVFLTLFKLCTLYQIAQSDLFCCSQFLECIDFKLWSKSYVGPDVRKEIASRNNSVLKGRNLCPFCPCRVFFYKKNRNSDYVGNKAKGRISKRVSQENKAPQIFRKTNISYPLIRTSTCSCQEVRNDRFSENLASFVLRLTLLPCYRRYPRTYSM